MFIMSSIVNFRAIKNATSFTTRSIFSIYVVITHKLYIIITTSLRAILRYTYNKVNELKSPEV